MLGLRDNATTRVRFVGTLMFACVVVVLVTICLTLPTLKESSIARGVEQGTGAAWWWPRGWRDEYSERFAASPRGAFLSLLPRGDESAMFNIVRPNYPTLDRVTLPESAEVAALFQSGDPTRLAVIRSAPEFELVDQSEQAVRAANLKGRVAIVSFIFTTCNGSCPATTHRLVQVRQELKSRGLLLNGNQVQFVSITLDPDRDTPDTLDRYRKLYDIDAAGWSFLTGPPENVRKVIDAWGMWARPAANGQLDHPSRIFLVDPKYRVREIYNLSFLKPAWVADDVKLLLDEASQ